MWLGRRRRSLQVWAAAGALWASACQFPNYSLGNDPAHGGSGATPAAGDGSGGDLPPVGGVGAAGNGTVGGAGSAGAGVSGGTGGGASGAAAGSTGGTPSSGGSEPLGGAGEGGMAGAPGDPSLLLTDDFESGKDQWFEVAGSPWALVLDAERGSHGYQLSPVFGDFYASAAKEGPWTDQIIEADVKVLQFGGTGTGDVASLFGRFGNIDNYYAAVLRPDGRAAIRASVNGSPPASIKTSAVLGITTGVWYRLRFELVGSALSLWVDGKLAMQIVDGSLSQGTIAVGGDNTAAIFDNVRVTRP